MSTISALILTKNEEEMLPDGLASVRFCDEIIVIDSGSTDKTVAIAEKAGATVISDTSSNFSEKRNKGFRKAHSDWVFYIDADERVSPELEKSLKEVISSHSEISAYTVERKNYYLGNHAWPEVENMERLFKKSELKEWVGVLHESPKFTGEVGTLSGYLYHYTHRDLHSMVKKTNQWSETEASLRFQAQHPTMAWWRFPRVMATAFFSSYIKQGGWKVGTVGFVESMYQAYSAFITYAKLWELQQKQTRLQKTS